MVSFPDLLELAMKKTLAMVALSVLVAAPALADDGKVSQSQLASLGLGGMEVVSDDAGMQVRGMSSNAWATSMTLFNMVLFDPNSGANFNANFADGARTTDENAGLNASSSATATTQVANPAPFTSTITFNGITWSANISAFTFGGMAQGTSP